jgi:hypothetical protein
LNFTSEEDVFEGEGVEDSEPVGGPHREATLVLVEVDVIDLLFGEVRGRSLHEGSRLHEGSHVVLLSTNIINSSFF